MLCTFLSVIWLPFGPGVNIGVVVDLDCLWVLVGMCFCRLYVCGLHCRRQLDVMHECCPGFTHCTRNFQACR